MRSSKLPLKAWGLALYLFTTSLKSASSMKLHRDLGVTQEMAWRLAQRIRKTWERDNSIFTGPVEVDATYIGGKERNKPGWKLRSGRVPLGMTPVVGMKDRETSQVRTAAITRTDRTTLLGFVLDNTSPDAPVFTD